LHGLLVIVAQSDDVAPFGPTARAGQVSKSKFRWGEFWYLFLSLIASARAVHWTALRRYCVALLNGVG
jgi:hypothetical protein